MIENLDGYVQHSIDKGIATVEFQHPMSNSLPGAILEKLAQTIKALGSDDEALVIILKSAGNKAFCAGASFDELITIESKDDGKKFFSGFAKVINEMRKCGKIVLCRVQGKAVGGGVGLASAADYTFAVSGASVKLSELAVGIGPFVVGPAVARKIGVSAFAELSIDATGWRDSAWAAEKGLYNQVFENEETMDEAILKLATTLANSSPDAMRDLKNVLWEGTEDWDQLLMDRAAISGRLVLGSFSKNAINAFKQK